MAEYPTTYTHTTRDGLTIVILDVPTTFDATGEEVGFRMSVSSVLEHMVNAAIQRERPADNRVELRYVAPAAPDSAPDPVSLELRRALREQRLTGREMAERLNVKPPVVSRWLSPDYHGHSMETLRRIADALDMDLEVNLKRRERKTG